MKSTTFLRFRHQPFVFFALMVLAQGACSSSESSPGEVASASGGIEGTGSVAASGGDASEGGIASVGGTSSGGGAFNPSSGGIGSGGTGTGGSGSNFGTGGEGIETATGGVKGNAGGAEGAGGENSGGMSGDPCPAEASFCSGFEDSNLPAGAMFKLNGDPATEWTAYFEVDTSVKNSGVSSLRVKTVSEAGGAYKMLAVPSGGDRFWVRLYLRSDIEMGASDHNVFAQASGSDDPNDGASVEFAEDVGMSFNSQDDVRWPEGHGRLDSGTKPYTLAAETWHCIELSFDGTTREQKLFVEGVEVISAADYPSSAMSFAVFKFGYNALHGTVRQLWYDDVALAPTRIGCL